MGRKKTKRKNKRGANGGHSDHHGAKSGYGSGEDSLRGRIIRKCSSPDMRHLPKVDETITVTSPTEAKLKIDSQVPEIKHKDAAEETGRPLPNIAAKVAKELGQRILEATKENVPPPQLRGTDFCPLLDQFTLEEAQPISIGKIKNLASIPHGFGDGDPSFAPLSDLVMGGPHTMAGASGYSSFLDSFNLPSSQEPMHTNDDDEEDEWADAEPEFCPFPDNKMKNVDPVTVRKEKESHCPFSKAEPVEEKITTKATKRKIEEANDGEEWSESTPVGKEYNKYEQEEKKDPEKEVIPETGGVKEKKDKQEDEEEEEWPEFSPFGEEFSVPALAQEEKIKDYQEIPVIRIHQETSKTEEDEEEWPDFCPFGDEFNFAEKKDNVDETKKKNEPEVLKDEERKDATSIQKKVTEKKDDENEEKIAPKVSVVEQVAQVVDEEQLFKVEPVELVEQMAQMEKVENIEQTEMKKPVAEEKPKEKIKPIEIMKPVAEEKPKEKVEPTEVRKPEVEEKPKEKIEPTEIVKPVAEEKPKEKIEPTEIVKPVAEEKPKEKIEQVENIEPTEMMKPEVEEKPKEKIEQTEMVKPVAEEKPNEKIEQVKTLAHTEEAEKMTLEKKREEIQDEEEEEWPEFSAFGDEFSLFSSPEKKEEPKENVSVEIKEDSQPVKDEMLQHVLDEKPESNPNEGEEKVEVELVKELAQEVNAEIGSNKKSSDVSVVQDLKDLGIKMDNIRSATYAENRYQEFLACVTPGAEKTKERKDSDKGSKLRNDSEKLNRSRQSSEAEDSSEKESEKIDEMKIEGQKVEKDEESREMTPDIASSLSQECKSMQQLKSAEVAEGYYQSNMQQREEKAKEAKEASPGLTVTQTSQQYLHQLTANLNKEVLKCQELSSVQQVIPKSHSSHGKEVSMGEEEKDDNSKTNQTDADDGEKKAIVEDMARDCSKMEIKKWNEQAETVNEKRKSEERCVPTPVKEEAGNDTSEEKKGSDYQMEATGNTSVETELSQLTDAKENQPVTYASIVKDTGPKLGHKIKIVEIDDAATQTSPKKSTRNSETSYECPEGEGVLCYHCGASLPLEGVGMAAEVLAERGRRLAAEEVAEMVEKEATTYRQQMVQFQTQVMQLEEENINLKSELTHERHLAAGYKSQCEDLTRALERSREMIVQLEDQLHQNQNSMSEAELVLEAQLANKRAAESLAKLEGAQADLDQSKIDRQRLQLQLTELIKEKNDMVPISIHTELVLQAEDRAKEMELRVLELETELSALSSQQQSPWSPGSPAQWGAVGNGRTSGGETPGDDKDWPTLEQSTGKQPANKLSWAYVAAKPPKEEVDIATLASSEQVPESPGPLAGLDVTRFAPSPQPVTPEVTSGEESDWSTSEESTSEKMPAVATALPAVAATAGGKVEGTTTGSTLHDTGPANLAAGEAMARQVGQPVTDEEGFKLANTRPPVPPKPKMRMRRSTSPKSPIGAAKSKVPPKVPPKPTWRPPNLGQGLGTVGKSHSLGERSSSFDEEAEAPKLKMARKPRGPADRRKPSKFAK